uniref:GED domain-containing protein n=1 Tax=Panagrellus redivivus TaxID=6233 RepID=A0A7E4UML6_PANRE
MHSNCTPPFCTALFATQVADDHLYEPLPLHSTINKVTAERVAAEKATALKDRQLAQLQELCRRLKSGGSGSPASEEPPATTSEASEAGETAPATSTVEADTNANSDEKPADTPTE